MIQTNLSAAVSWPVAGSSSGAAVPPVLAVAPAAAASGDNRAAMEHAPEQPRQAAAEVAASAPTPAEREEQAAEALARREARYEAQRETVERLRETLRKVWDASGAVVEQALAREAERASAGQVATVQRRAGIIGYSEPVQSRPPPDPLFDERV